jgi:uncharacterized protein involved in exopolysaccharide biosynthesis
VTQPAPPTAKRPSWEPEPDDSDSLLPLGTTLLRARRLLARLALLGAVIGVVTGLLHKRTYSANAAFTPQSRRTGSNLAGLAAQFGIAVPAGDAAQSPAFFADLMESRELLKPLLTARFAGADGIKSRRTLAEWLEPTGSTEARRRENLLERLRQMIDASVAQKTGVVRVTVSAPDPVLAQEVDSALIDRLNRFNLETRQSQASAERRFTEERLAQVRVSLNVAEDRLRGFLEANRNYVQSPNLRFQEERLNRDVTLQQQLFVTLSQAYEQAKIEEVRDTPVITVIERPEVPARPDSRKTLLRAVIGLFVGLLVGMAIALVRAADRGLSRSTVASEWRSARTAFAGDLRRPWRFLVGRDD